MELEIPTEPAPTIEALCALLKPPRGVVQKLKFWRRGWKARYDAVYALGESGEPAAIPALVEALFDPHPRVSGVARLELPEFGEASVKPLLNALQNRDDWNLRGMEAVIELLGERRDKRATAPLCAVLSEHFPLYPHRWSRSFFRMPFLIIGSILALPLLGYLIHADLSWPNLYALLTIPNLITLFVYYCIPLTACYIFLLLTVVAPIHIPFIVRERKALTNAAARALFAIQDKAALPELIYIVTEVHTRRHPIVRRTLASLLYQVEVEDQELFRPVTRTQLTTLLGDPDARLVLAVVRAMEFAGTGQAVRPMERLVRRGATPEIRAEAARVLPVLQERQRQEQNEAYLLRASSLPTRPEQLLRPAAVQAHTPSEQLLRAVRPTECE